MPENPQEHKQTKSGHFSGTPSTVQQAFLSLLWSSRRRRLWVAIILFGVVALSVWQSIPDKDKSHFIRIVSTILAPTDNVADLRIQQFVVANTADEEITWLRTKLERKLVEFFSDSGLRVSHSLTPVSSKTNIDHVLVGSISRKGKRLTLEVSLNKNDIVVSSAQLEGAFPVLEKIYSQFAKALVYGMDVDPRTLESLNSKSRPTESAMSYALYLAAQKSASSKEYNQAISYLDFAIETEPKFAMAYWAKGELYRLSGDAQQEKELKETATRIDTDHQRHPIFLNVKNPMPALLSRSLKSTWRQLAEGVSTSYINLPEYNLSLHAWAFDPTIYEISVATQMEETGSTALQFREKYGALLAINGGYFEIDGEDRLWPSGLLIVNSQQLYPYVETAGSGVLYQKDGVIRLGWIRNRSTYAGSTSAVQSGPLVVDPGGRNGIYKNDYNRRKRSAICFANNLIVLISVVGDGLSLFEFGDFLSKGSAQGGIGCERALNLDGGASTQASFALGSDTIEIEGTWKIQNAVIVKQK